jgi:hypothetical protein
MARFIITVFLTLMSVKSIACSCGPSKYNEDLLGVAKNSVLSAANTDFVAVAKAVNVDEDSQKKGVFIQNIEFSLVTRVKGDLKNTFTLFGNDISGGSCGYFFEQGKTYLLYMKSSWSGNLSTNSCTRTKAKPSDFNDGSKERWATEVSSILEFNED